jgi:hypothetical protein
MITGLATSQNWKNNKEKKETLPREVSVTFVYAHTVRCTRFVRRRVFPL